LKILYLDIETAPTSGYFYNRYDVRISPDQVIDNGFILCYQAAWNDGKIFTNSLRENKKFPLTSKSDKGLVKEIAKHISNADVVVAHNAHKFDLSLVSARLAAHNLKPYNPVQVIDTLRVCKRFFKFESNSLDSVCQELGIGRKFHSGGFETSIACIAGDQKAWDKLLKYGKHDVNLLRDLYKRLRPWISNHPNPNLFDAENRGICTKCGSSNLVHNGKQYTPTMVYQRYLCRGCGGHSYARHTCLDKEKRKTILKG